MQPVKDEGEGKMGKERFCSIDMMCVKGKERTGNDIGQGATLASSQSVHRYSRD